MAADRNLLVQILIVARDQASGVFKALFSYLDDNTRVISGKIRGAFSGLFGGGLGGAIEFEAALARVVAKSGAGEAELKKLKTAAQEWARAVGLGADGATQAAQALEFLTGAGLSADQAIAALGSTLRVAKNEQISTQQAATALTDVLSVMGLKYQEAARAGDVLQKSADLTSTSVSALAEAIRQGGGEAVKAGLTFEQTVVLLTAFAKAGIQGSEAGTALANVLRDITDPASQARRELAKFGESTGDVSQFIGRLIELGPRGNQVIRAFAQESGPGLAALLRVGTDGLAEYGRALEKDAVGGLEKASATINTTTKGALERLATAWGQIKTTLAEPLLKPIADGAEALSKTLGDLLASGKLQSIADGIKNLYVDAARYVDDFLKKVDWDRFKTQAGDAIAAVRTALDQTIDGVQGEIQTVSDWTSAVFSPLTQAIDGYRLAWALANKDQDAAVRLQQQIEARTAAIGRALSGTSAEYANAGAAARTFGAATEGAARATDALQAAQQAAAARVAELAEATKQQEAEVQRLYEANARGQASTEDYSAAVVKLWELQGQLKTAQAAATAAQKDATEATAQAVPVAERHAAALEKTWAETDAVSIAALKYQNALAETNQQIQAAANNAGDWSEGLRLNGVQLLGLKDAAAATADQLALVRQAQRDGLATTNDVQAATKAANDAQDRYTKALAAWVTQQETALDAAKRANDLEQQGIDLDVKRAQAAVDLAKAKGDANAQSQAEAALSDLLQQKADAAVAGKQREIEAYQALIDATRQKLEADGQLDVAEQAQLAEMADKRAALELERQSLETTAQAIRDQAAAVRESAKAQADAAKTIADAKDHAEQLAAAGDLVSGALTGWAQRLQALSPAAREAFDGFKQGSDIAAAGIEELNAAMSKNMDEQSKLTGAGSGFAAWANQVADKALDIEASFLGQASAVQQLIDRLGAIGSATGLDTLIRQAERSREQFDLLDRQRLDNLQSAIDAATDRLRQMQEEAASAKDRLAELNAEIAREKGDTATADRLRLELEQRQALAEVEANLAQARLEQNQELIQLYEVQKQKLQELYDLKERNLKQENAAAKPTTGAAATPPSATGGGAGVSGGGGISITVNANNAKLLDQNFVADLARQLQPELSRMTRLSA